MEVFVQGCLSPRELVVDDFAGFRDAICSMLSNCPDLQVVAEASDGLEAVRMGSGSPPMMVSEKAEAFTLRKQLLLFDSGVVLKLHHEGDAKFPSVLEHEIFQTERNQEGLEGGIERQTTLILHQTLKPLYDELYQKE